MRTWKAGDIITTEKWTSLNNIYPKAKRINWYDQSNLIFDIQYDELKDLYNHEVFCWVYDEINGYLQDIDEYSNYSIAKDDTTGKAYIDYYNNIES